MEKGTRKWPFLLHEFTEETKDLLITGHDCESRMFRVSTCPVAVPGLTLISTASKNGAKESSGAVRALYKYNKHIGADIQFDSMSQISGNLTLNKQFLQSGIAQVTFRFPHYTSSKLNVVYLLRHAAFSMSTALHRFPKFGLSTSIGSSGIDFGMELGITKTSFFGVLNAGLQVTKPSYQATILLTNKGDMLKASYFHNLSKAKNISAAIEMSRCLLTKENTFLAGGSWGIDHLTVVKAKVDNHGKLNTLLQLGISKKVLLSISGGFDIKAMDRKPEIGFGITLKL
ncbi:Eukaryotic porin [Parasponia andersonii]|uniref:Eukaryotic porin n=1 Tax=Parasponia andersonii TaxID=3476 RepID=A0A2P5DNG0_PARAD|nr:Eukaryotic porin [Parasponia andersonii]